MKRSAASVIPPHLGADAFIYIDAPCSPTYVGSKLITVTVASWANRRIGA